MTASHSVLPPPAAVSGMIAPLRWTRLVVALAAGLCAALGLWLDFAIHLWLAQAFLVALVHQVVLGQTQAGLVGAGLGGAECLGNSLPSNDR